MTVIDSKQLTSKEFKTATGCEIAVPGSASYAESEQCFRQRFAAVSQPGNVSPAKGDGKAFKRSYKTEAECVEIICSNSRNCTSQGCQGCVVPTFGPPDMGYCYAYQPPPPAPPNIKLTIPYIIYPNTGGG